MRKMGGIGKKKNGRVRATLGIQVLNTRKKSDTSKKSENDLAPVLDTSNQEPKKRNGNNTVTKYNILKAPVLNTGEYKMDINTITKELKKYDVANAKHSEDAEGIGTGFDILDAHQIYNVELSAGDIPQEILVTLKSQNDKNFNDVRIPLEVTLSNRMYAILTTTLNDSGANIAMASHATMLKNGKLIKAAVAGLSEKSVIDHVGTLGKVTSVYAGANLHKNIIPPQKFIEFTNGKIMLLHTQVKKDPPIHMVFGIQRDKPIKILSVSSPETNNIMVWTVAALKELGIQNYTTSGKITLTTKIKDKKRFKNKIQINNRSSSVHTVHNAAFAHIDVKDGEIELKKACLDGLSNTAINNQRMTGLGTSRDVLSQSNERLKLYNLMAKFSRRNRPRKTNRSVPINQDKLFECIQVDIIFFSELESTGSNKSIITRGGFTAMLLAVDKFSRMSWVEPIRTEKQDFFGSLNIIFIKISQLARGLKISPPSFIQSDKAPNQRPTALKEFLINHKLVLKPVMPGSNDLKVLDRFVRTLREATNLGLIRSDNLIEFTHEIMRESNRRLIYRTSADGSRASPFELVHGIVPSLDHVYPPQGTTVLVKASLSDKVGCTTGIYLHTNEEEGSYSIYLPRVDALVVRQNVLFITLKSAPDRLLKMMSGQRIFDEDALIQGHVVDLKDRLRGPVVTRCTNKPWKGAWYIIEFDNQNRPTSKPFECTCLKTFSRLSELKRHWTLEVNKSRRELQGAEKHPDPMIRPGGLSEKQKKRQKDFRKVEFEKLVRSSNGKNGVKLGRLTTYNKDMNTSQYNLRNRSVDGKDAAKILRRTRVEEMKEARMKDIAKVKAKESVAKLKASHKTKIKSVQCPVDGCLAQLPGTPSGRHSKLMKEHLALHEIQKKKDNPRRSTRLKQKGHSVSFGETKRDLDQCETDGNFTLKSRGVRASLNDQVLNTSRKSENDSTSILNTSNQGPENNGARIPLRTKTQENGLNKSISPFARFAKDTIEEDYLKIKSPLQQTQVDYNAQVKTALYNVYTASVEEASDNQKQKDQKQKVKNEKDSQEKGESKQEIHTITQDLEYDEFGMHNIQTNYNDKNASY